MSRVADATGAAAAREITPLILTFNEAPNIGRCLERLAWAARVVVLDSGSTDDTVAIARQFPNVDLRERRFDNFASQRNHGLALIDTPWVLSIDADHIVPAAFPAAIAAFGLGAGLDAVSAGFRYCIFGRPLRGSLYPPRPVLFRPTRCHYEADGHSEHLVVSGQSATMGLVIDHDDRKPLGRWLASQAAYARLEAEKLLAQPASALDWPDRLRRSTVLGPLGAGFYALIVKGALLDGWPGWYYALQRMVAEGLLSLELIGRRLRR